MIFEVINDKIEPVVTKWSPSEYNLENLIINTEDGILNDSIFGESLLLVKNQQRTRVNKIADIFALDQQGNGVIIELKKEIGYLGVETQALQYLADFAYFKGQQFIDRFKVKEETIFSFLGANLNLEEINKNSRIILIAQSFDKTLFSMGEWLSEKGVPFRCIEYAPFKIEGKHYISFSVAFDRSSDSIFPISFRSSIREPGIFWHNIAYADQNWWECLVNSKCIPACFSNQRGDEGDILLNKYITGDKIIAYAKGFGAIGYGVIEQHKYFLVEKDSEEDFLQGDCMHRLKISWKYVARKLTDGISPEIIRKNFKIYHPLRTSVSIEKKHGDNLIEFIISKFIKIN